MPMVESLLTSQLKGERLELAAAGSWTAANAGELETLVDRVAGVAEEEREDRRQKQEIRYEKKQRDDVARAQDEPRPIGRRRIEDPRRPVGVASRQIDLNDRGKQEHRQVHDGILGHVRLRLEWIEDRALSDA